MSPFWALENYGDRVALIASDGRKLSYAGLAREADAWSSRLPAHRCFGFLQLPNNTMAIACYLGCLRGAMHSPLLLQSTMSQEQIERLSGQYEPDWLLLVDTIEPSDGYIVTWQDHGLRLHVSAQPRNHELHPSLAILLNTSGTTGSSKLVRLSAKALASNAAAITEYLGISVADRAISSLPLAYSFGMSILNSHLERGAALVLTDATMMDREFWHLAKLHEVTSLSGVPATFEMLQRLGLERLGLKHLRMLTQAGGRLRESLACEMSTKARKLGIDFHVMYGQTEASPRISHVPPDRLEEKAGSIGIPIPGGRMECDPETGELIYSGDNVMMGYAENRSDLALGDTQRGQLRTGDIARMDDEGYYYIVGRLKRFVKVSGNRVNLDDVERMLSLELGTTVACAGSDDALHIFMQRSELCTDDAQPSKLVQEKYRLYHGHVFATILETIPLLASGKIDYQHLSALAVARNAQ